MENFPQNRASNSQSGAVPPKSWLVESILVTLFCCLPLGIVGIINASSVENKFATGDYAGAERASRLAKTMVIISALSSVAILLMYILFFGGLALFNFGDYQ